MVKRILTDFRRKYLRFGIAEQRRKLKLKCVEYKGGKCIICGYNKCPAALSFHHLNPEKKDFQISGSTRNFEKCKPELDKCILLCNNCHAEIHYEEARKAREIIQQEIELEKRSYTIQR